ncbi:MAG: efflux RND transporter periplasmic adaptor subunit [Bacteroidota bacterium]|nr:efflux RND transporter periplasmic adaptor subunit [Bacteroidota bacterium]
MKNIVYFLLLTFLFSCGASSSNVDIKNRIIELKDQVAKTNMQIRELEKQLAADSSYHNIDYSVPVAIKKIDTEQFMHFFECNGSVEAVNAAFVSPEINGQVKTVYVKEGERVKKGQLLIKLNTSVLESGIEELKLGLELAHKIYNKQKTLYDQQIGSEIQYLEAKNNKESLEKKIATLEAQLDMSIIRAPFAGIVDNIFVKKGEIAAPGMQVLQLVNLSEIYINADVSENYLSKINKSDKVLLSFPAYPEIKMEVDIWQIANVINKQNRTFRLRLKIDNKDEKFKPNMLSVLKINDFKSDSAIVVPSIIIKQDINGYFLFVTKQDGEKLLAKKVYVKPGISAKDFSIIENGLEVGDHVLTKGYNMVTNGSEIIVK